NAAAAAPMTKPRRLSEGAVALTPDHSDVIGQPAAARTARLSLNGIPRDLQAAEYFGASPRRSRRLDPKAVAALERNAPLRYRRRPARGLRQAAEGEERRRNLAEMTLAARVRQSAHQAVGRRHREQLSHQPGLPRQPLRGRPHAAAAGIAQERRNVRWAREPDPHR